MRLILSSVFLLGVALPAWALPPFMQDEPARLASVSSASYNRAFLAKKIDSALESIRHTQNVPARRLLYSSGSGSSSSTVDPNPGTAEQKKLCTEFSTDFMGLLFVQTSNSMAQRSYATGCGMNDFATLFASTDQSVYSKWCSTGTPSANACGSDGFYAKVKPLGPKYVGMLHPDCSVVLTFSAHGANHTINMGKATVFMPTITMATSMLCIESSSTYFPKFMKANTDVGNTLNAGGAPSLAQITTLCTPCTDKLMQSIFMAQGDPTAKQQTQMLTKSMETMCGKIGKVFCFPAYAKYTMAAAGASNITLKNKAKFFCTDPCSTLMKGKEIEMMKLTGQANVDMQEAMFKAQCFKNGQTTCFEYLDTAGQSTSPWAKMVGSCGAPAQGPDTQGFDWNTVPACSDNCKVAFDNIKATWGCCWQTLRKGCHAQFMNWMSSLETKCGKTPPAECPKDAGAKPVSFEMNLPNLALSYANAHKNDTVKKVVTDVAMGTGVPYKSCKATSGFTKCNSGTCIKMQCSPATAVQTGNLAGILNSINKNRRSGGSTGMVFAATSTLPANSRVNPAQGQLANTNGKASCGSTCPADNLAQAGKGASAALPTPTPTPTPKKPSASPTPAGKAPTPAAKVKAVSASVSLAGMSKADFTEKVQTAFKKTIAASMKICGSSGSAQCTDKDVVILSFSRRALAVKLYVKAPAAKDADAGAAATGLDTFLKNTDAKTGFAAKFIEQAKVDAPGSTAAKKKASDLKVTVTAAPKAGTVTQKTTTASGASTTATVSLVSLAMVALTLQ
jgi:hypothetical protein